ncbi:hypothetical protein BGY98DRAFT_942342 [Russula aff. rugulosa BPL654]|nr:hypothetical protein BGY98DRAFT_942342 [Russula aff. rugulosa BPL654]
MTSKPTPLPRLLPFESFFMRLPSSSSLLLASLAVSSSSSSLSALAAPVGDGPAPGPPPPSVPPQGSDDAMAQPNGYLQASDPLIGQDAPKAREAPQTTRAEEADHGRGEHAASEGSSMQPFTSQPEASTPPVAGRQDAPVIAPNPPAGCSSQPSPQSGPANLLPPILPSSPLPSLPDPAPPAPPAPSGSAAGGSADGTTTG